MTKIPLLPNLFIQHSRGDFLKVSFGLCITCTNEFETLFLVLIETEPFFSASLHYISRYCTPYLVLPFNSFINVERIKR